MSTEQAEPWTVLRLLQWTTEYFKKRGSESARLDAEVLLAEARNCSRIDLYTAFNSEPSAEEREAFRELVRRRGEGTPVAYLVGKKEFYSIPFRVNESTLIPRPETEHLVVEALDQIKRLQASLPADHEPLQIADIGTGSGAIAIAIAKNSPHGFITACDVSAAALEVAKYNVEQQGLQERIHLVHSDCLNSVSAPPTFDIICSNPPYVSEAEYEELATDVKKFEPRSALVSGPTGTEIISRLIEQSCSRLRPGGQLIIELSPMIAEKCAALVVNTKKFAPPKLIKDLAGHRRILSVTRLV